MFVTIIVLYIFFIGIIWAIVYGGSQNKSIAEQEFEKAEQQKYIELYQRRKEEKRNRKKSKRKLRWNYYEPIL